MKLGILGGSFNPIHLGHLFLAEKVLTALNLDRVVFIPAYVSPFKKDCSLESCNDRLDMLAAAITGDIRFAIDSCEIKRQGVSYTIDTLEDIITRYLPTGKPVLIIGDDLAKDFPKWRDSERILQLADIAIAKRINAPAFNYPYAHISIENDIMVISSQSIRQKIKDDADWMSLVPSGARAIIQDRKLYNYKGQKLGNTQFTVQQSDIQRIETAVRESLTTERFIHSRNTALMAVDLCRRFGLDPMAGYLAGVAHDLAKQLDNKQLLKIIKADGQEISALEKDKPNLLHGKAAAVLLRDRFCIHNKDVLDAVAFHTSGCENMVPLAKVIYIADKVECSRNIDTSLRSMCAAQSQEIDLDSILYTVLEKTVVKLRARELDLSEDTLMLLNKMKERKI